MYKKPPIPVTEEEYNYISENFFNALNNILTYVNMKQEEYKKMNLWQRWRNSKKYKEDMDICTYIMGIYQEIETAFQDSKHYGLDNDDFEFIKYWCEIGEDDVCQNGNH